MLVAVMGKRFPFNFGKIGNLYNSFLIAKNLNEMLVVWLVVGPEPI